MKIHGDDMIERKASSIQVLFQGRVELHGSVFAYTIPESPFQPGGKCLDFAFSINDFHAIPSTRLACV